jgi:hypothetical protein
MQWQDFAITAGTITFIFALIPSIYSNNKPAMATSLMTGSVLTVFTIVYITLSLWFSAVTTAITALLWFVLSAQMFLKGKK